MERSDLQKKLLQLLADNFLYSSQFDNLSAAELDKVNLQDEMLLDSLDAVELSMRIEKEFGVAFTGCEEYDLLSKSFGEVTDFVLARLKN